MTASTPAHGIVSVVDAAPQAGRPRRTPRPSSAAARRDLVAIADRASLGSAPEAFAAAVRQLLPAVDRDLSFELVAVIELASHDVELATLRWSNLRRRL